MRLFFSAVSCAAVAALLATSGQAQSKQKGEFSAARLTAPPATSWPTNGGNLYNQRYSPLTAINRANVAQLKGVWRARLRGSGTAPQLLRRRAADRSRRRRVRDHWRQRRVRAVDRHRRDTLAIHGEPRPSHQLGVLRLEQPRCGDQRRQSLHGPARWPTGGARSDDRQARVVDSGRALAGQLLDHGSAVVLQRHGHHRFCRRGSRHPWSREGVRREGRPAHLDFLHDSRSW